MIYTAQYVMFLMWANPLRGQVGGGWILESRLLGPVEWHGADRQVPYHSGSKIVEIFREHPPPICRHQKHYVLGRINQMSIGSFMYKSSHGGL